MISTRNFFKVGLFKKLPPFLVVLNTKKLVKYSNSGLDIRKDWSIKLQVIRCWFMTFSLVAIFRLPFRLLVLSDSLVHPKSRFWYLEWMCCGEMVLRQVEQGFSSFLPIWNLFYSSLWDWPPLGQSFCFDQVKWTLCRFLLDLDQAGQYSLMCQACYHLVMAQAVKSSFGLVYDTTLIWSEEILTSHNCIFFRILS